MNDLKGKHVAIIVTDGFEQIELTSPREALENAGATCVLMAQKSGEVQGFQHHDRKDKFTVEMTLDRADANEFDAVMLPGGVINADAIRIDKNAQRFVKEIDQAGKPIAVICHGPWLLISAGLMKGHTITSWPTLEHDLRNAGAIWKDAACVRDKNWVSSRKPADLPAFNREMVTLISEQRGTRKTLSPSRADELRP